ncbi:hypothetical protein ILUMI_14041 [Ignelater luminosus]|uniref:DUF4371 domain-containing protein n=1 Tax=Ignelater luminosus TaxID=2038154 RepID=A0A8K0CXC1_IGNLU|nr:hypothetical protein ILUMI_14041 [Ignelater luminosus]
MAEHLRQIVNKQISDHYLGPSIQNELINLLGSKVCNEIKLRVKTSEYFLILLDGIPDNGHDEQLTLTLRIVDITDKAAARIEEYFVTFVHITSKTGLSLTKELKHQINI